MPMTVLGCNEVETAHGVLRACACGHMPVWVVGRNRAGVYGADVLCNRCGRHTCDHATLAEAVDAWNKSQGGVQ